jgi:hypothetical protein
VNGEAGSAGGTIPLQASISYIEKIEPAPKLAFVFVGGEEGLLLNDATGAVEGSLTKEGVEEHCGVAGAGAAAAPSAEPGNLCVFVGTMNEVSPADFLQLIIITGQSDKWKSPAPTSGAIVPFALEEFGNFGVITEGGFASGSWAVAK